MYRAGCFFEKQSPIYSYKLTDALIAMLKDSILLQVELIGFKQGHRVSTAVSLLLNHFMLNEDIDR